MSGTIHETMHAVVEVEDHSMEASNRTARQRRQEVIREAAQFQSRLIERVITGILKDSKLQMDVSGETSARQQGERAAAHLVVSSGSVREAVSEITQGASALPFFQQSVELDRLHRVLDRQEAQPATVEDVVDALKDIVKHMRDEMLNEVDEASVGGVRSSMEYLSKPHNSFIIRMKPEAYAAIRSSYAQFTTEWRQQGLFEQMRHPCAWELIEGQDMNLCTAFAEFCAHKMAHSRLFSSSHLAYIGVAPARANAMQLKATLHKLLQRAIDYVQVVPAPNFHAGMWGLGYVETPQNTLEFGRRSTSELPNRKRKIGSLTGP